MGDEWEEEQEDSSFELVIWLSSHVECYCKTRTKSPHSACLSAVSCLVRVQGKRVGQSIARVIQCIGLS